MDKKLFKYEICGFIFVCFLGTLSHFFFDWSGENRFIGLFCPVNESVWEHLKLIYTPYLIWSIFELFKLKQKAGFFFAKSVGIFCGMFVIISVFYIYTGATGNENMVIDIISFLAGSAAAFIISFTCIKNNYGKSGISNIISTILFSQY
ncbi:MAG: DUF6512 family protein [Clostridiales bacterium]|nr:DUF6512 family protein [Clostridiales bacterium]